MARTRSVPCRTTMIEERIRQDLIRTDGRLLTEKVAEKIAADEEKRLMKQARSIKKARIKLLQQKERVKIIQAVRKGSYHKEGGAPVAPPKKATVREWRFNAIDVSY